MALSFDEDDASDSPRPIPRPVPSTRTASRTYGVKRPPEFIMARVLIDCQPCGADGTLSPTGKRDGRRGPCGSYDAISRLCRSRQASVFRQVAVFQRGSQFVGGVVLDNPWPFLEVLDETSRQRWLASCSP